MTRKWLVFMSWCSNPQMQYRKKINAAQRITFQSMDQSTNAYPHYFARRLLLNFLTKARQDYTY